MFFSVLRALRHLPYRPLTSASVLLALAWVTGRVPRWDSFTWRVQLTAAVIASVVLLHWGLTWLSPAFSTGRWVRRRDEASQHAGGVATFTDIGELSSSSRLRRRLTQLRPSFRDVSWWQRRRTPLTEIAVELIRTSPVRTNTVWSPCDEVTLRIGGPRSGKSGSLACHALDAPGALIVTTTRTDLLEDTHAERAGRGRVFVFNPTGLGTAVNPDERVDDAESATGGRWRRRGPAARTSRDSDLVIRALAESTVRWSPLVGCEDFGTATRRAGDLIPAGSSAEGERWDEQARSLLATLLHAAARSGRSMRTVLGWISPPDALARDEILEALRSSPDARAMSSQIVGLYGTNDRTLTSITTTLLPRLRWVLDPRLAAAADAPLDDPGLLDVAAFVARGRDSLYLLGRHDGAPTILGALTAEVAHQVRLHAARQPKGRLDPPMTAVLDEIKNTCGPIPLDEWTSDMGGFNFTIHMGAQSLAQLDDLWGPARAGAVLGNVGSLLVFGGIKDDDTLEHVSTLCGTRLVAVDADDNRPLPVMTPSEIGALRLGEALVIRTGMRPLVGRAPWVGDRAPSRLRTAAVWVARRCAAGARALDAAARTQVAAVAAARTARAAQRVAAARAEAAARLALPAPLTDRPASDALTDSRPGTSADVPGAGRPVLRVVEDATGPLAPFADLEAVARPTPDDAVAAQAAEQTTEQVDHDAASRPGVQDDAAGPAHPDALDDVQDGDTVPRSDGAHGDDRTAAGDEAGGVA